MRIFRVFLFVFAFAVPCLAQMHQGQELVKAELVADASGIVPGRPLRVGLHLQPLPGWHTYWQYAGDAGVPTTIDWTLPEGFAAGPIRWPVPSVDKEDGEIWNYVYPGNVLLPVEIEAPANLRPGQSVTLRAHATWLVCKDLCVPGKADLTLTLPVVAASQPANAGLFQAADLRTPKNGPPPFTPVWSRQGKNLILTLKGLQPGAVPELFPLPGDVQIGHPEATEGGAIRVPLLDETAKADSIDGVVKLKRGSAVELWQLQWRAATVVQSAMPSGSLLGWLFWGFLGGLILNVMPCVLPVIALKLFGFIRQAGESPRRLLALGFTFIAGIFAWFLLLAALAVGFKAAGHHLNWAFQFQHPAFVATMVVVLLVFALNLLGVFEILLPGRVQNRVGELSSHEGYTGTFLHGVFATLMATPCTAPFLGPALGFALSQPAPIVFAMFASIAAGMSAPYAVLAVKPGWLRFLPKPGLWMVRVKQALGVLLMGTVIWLSWVLWQQLAHRPEPFRPRLAAALQEHKIVFVDFTADWCVNCKANERLVLDSAPVRQAFHDKGVIVLKADWTNGSEDITQLLNRFGRAGVPLYVVYSPDGKPIVLPEVITKEIVLGALEQAAE